MAKKILLEFSKEELNFLDWAMAFIEGGPFNAKTETQRDAAEFKIRKALSDYHERTSSSPKGLQIDSFWFSIHPTIKRVSKSRYESGHYADSVEAAFKQINKEIKEIVKSASGEELDGAALMFRAFSPNKPIIKLGDMTTETGVNIQKGYMRIPVISHTDSGAYRTVRRGETLVEYIVHQVCAMVRNPRSFLWESPSKERQ